jgi:Zn-dependent protease
MENNGMQEINTIFQVAILLMSVVIHEVSHGWAALIQGDHTAKLAGRLTLNPLRHLDPIGSVLLPILTAITTGFVFGWAKPVPYNPANLRNKRTGTIIVAASGAAANFIVAIFFSFIIRLALVLQLSNSFIAVISTIVLINLILATFNLMPIPPLDGSRILFSLLPARLHRLEAFLEQYALVILVLFIYFFSSIIIPIIKALFLFFTGQPL